MRRFLLAAMMFGTAFSAQAADLPDFLRGSLSPSPSPRVNWQGYYIGAQAAYGSSDENFSGATSNMVAPLIANDVIQQMGVAGWNLQLGKQSARAPGYGGFAGYNAQWEDVVLGLEASYIHGTFGGSATASESLVSGTPLTDGNYHAVTATSLAAISITDMATLRARAGYAYNNFLPYVFGGVALGNADITRSVIIQDNYASTFARAVSSCSGATPPFCTGLSASNDVHNHLIYGYTMGLGVDINLIGGLFMRAEWEYARFASQIDTSVNTGRVGLGYKF